VIPLAELKARIEAITVSEVNALAATLFPEGEDKLTIAAVGPFDPEHQALLAGETDEMGEAE
jgi:predicted Zn-dependent peptidase